MAAQDSSGAPAVPMRHRRPLCGRRPGHSHGGYCLPDGPIAAKWLQSRYGVFPLLTLQSFMHMHRNLFGLHAPKKYYGKKLDLSSETLALVSPSAAAFTQSSQDVAGKNEHSSGNICSTEGCVLAGNRSSFSL